jgi:predicted DNA-binding transcriptional regulator AlpA
MAPKVNTEDLLDAGEVAAILGLSGRTAVSVYRSRYQDFPMPILEKSRMPLWLRADIEDWGRSRGRLK